MVVFYQLNFPNVSQNEFNLIREKANKTVKIMVCKCSYHPYYLHNWGVCSEHSSYSDTHPFHECHCDYDMKVVNINGIDYVHGHLLESDDQKCCKCIVHELSKLEKTKLT